MPPLNVNAQNSAMAGYNPQQGSTSSGSPLTGILDTILQLGGMMGGEALGGPVGAALGSGLGTGAGELLGGHGLNAGQIGQGALQGLMPGMLGGKLAGKAAEDVAGNVAKDATSSAPALAGDLSSATDGTAPLNATSSGAGEGNHFVVDPNGNITTGENAAPTSINPVTGEGHVNFNQNPETGFVTADNTNTFTPETPSAQPSTSAQATAPVTQSVPPQPATPPLTTTTQTSPTDTFTQATPPANSQLTPAQKVAQGAELALLKQQVQEGGSRLTQAEANQIAQNLQNDGYGGHGALGAAERDANLVTGNTGILSNGVNDHINNAEANGASLNFGDYNDIAQKNINEAKLNGVLSSAQEKSANLMLNGVRDILIGPTEASDTGGLVHVLPSNAIKAARVLGDRADRQFLIAQGRGPAADGAKELGSMYNQMGSDIMDRAFGTTSGNAPISDENINNMISQVKGANFENPEYQQNLISTLESGKGGNMSLQDLRHLQANHVAYSQAANPNEIGNLANSLMSVGKSRQDIASTLLNSSPALTAKIKVAHLANKLLTPGVANTATDAADIAPSVESAEATAGATKASENEPAKPTSGGIISKLIKPVHAAGPAANTATGATKTTSGGRTMSPLGKGAAVAGILAALGLGGDAIATHNQASNASALLNSPQYQQTQNVLNQSNQLQRYLGQMGEIRSVFAPTFDTNAGQAGTTGQTLLASANQNQAANTAANNLLAARAHMGLGGIPGGILALIPGTPENTYKQQAANAQAQLNALGIAGSAPAVSQGGGSIPALTSMAGNVGAF